MRRLSPPHPLTRLREERGGIAVMLALLMPVLFGVSALAIDTAAVWSARQQVESGADAAVLAVATDCARGECGDIKKTAEDAFFANNRAAKLSDLGAGEGRISVSGRDVDVVQTRPWVVNHFFAAALGQGTGELSVQSHAAWAPAASARADVPVAISWCTYREEVGGNGPDASDTATILLDTVHGTTTCTGPTGSAGVPAGVAMTTPGSGSCTATSTRSDTVAVAKKKYGPGLGSSCTDAHLTGLVGRDVWLPVWGQATPLTGSSPTYRVHGYAAFRVTSVTTGSTSPSLTGHFTRAPRQTDATTPPPTDAPDLGARAVFLTEN